MSFGNAISNRELKARAVAAVQSGITAGRIQNDPRLSDTPIYADDAEDDVFPAIHVFGAQRDSRTNTKQKLYAGLANIAIGVEAVVQVKTGYDDEVDQLADEVIAEILQNEDVMKPVRRCTGYTRSREFEKAAIVLAKEIITISFELDEKLLGINAGDPAPLTEVQAKFKISEDETQNPLITVEPPQP